MQQSDPYSSHRFLIEVEEGMRAGFQEVSGYDASIDVVEHRNGNEVRTSRKLPGLTKYGNITLTNGVTADVDLWNWFQDAINGRVSRKDILIVAFDDARQEVARWIVRNAWPCKYVCPDWNGTASEVRIDMLELAHEGIQRAA